MQAEYLQIRSNPSFSDLIKIILRRLLLLSVHSKLSEPLAQNSLLELATGMRGITPFLTCLKLGEFLHTGKVATMGFGKYNLMLCS